VTEERERERSFSTATTSSSSVFSLHQSRRETDFCGGGGATKKPTQLAEKIVIRRDSTFSRPRPSLKISLHHYSRSTVSNRIVPSPATTRSLLTCLAVSHSTNSHRDSGGDHKQRQYPKDFWLADTKPTRDFFFFFLRLFLDVLRRQFS